MSWVPFHSNACSWSRLISSPQLLLLPFPPCHALAKFERTAVTSPCPSLLLARHSSLPIDTALLSFPMLHLSVFVSLCHSPRQPITAAHPLISFKNSCSTLETPFPSSISSSTAEGTPLCKFVLLNPVHHFHVGNACRQRCGRFACGSYGMTSAEFLASVYRPKYFSISIFHSNLSAQQSLSQSSHTPAPVPEVVVGVETAARVRSKADNIPIIAAQQPPRARRLNPSGRVPARQRSYACFPAPTCLRRRHWTVSL